MVMRSLFKAEAAGRRVSPEADQKNNYVPITEDKTHIAN
jgi:hypothetical protein